MARIVSLGIFSGAGGSACGGAAARARLALILGAGLVSGLIGAGLLPGCGSGEAAGGAGEAPDSGQPLLGMDGPSQVFLGEEACFSPRGAPEGARVEFLWGDGNRSELGALSACHSWQRAGFFTIGFRVQLAGEERWHSQSLLVLRRPLQLAPQFNTSILVSPENHFVYVVNPDNSSVSVVDPEGERLVQEIELCDEPRSLALSGGYLAVACQGSGELVQLELGEDGSLAQPKRLQFSPGSEPYGVAADPRGGAFYLTQMGAGRLSSVAVGEARLIQELETKPEPRGIGVLPDGRLWVSHWRASAEGARLSQFSAPEPGSLSAPATAEQSLLLPPDRGLNSDTNNDGVPSFLNQVAIAPAGHELWLPSLKANNQTGLFLSGNDLTFDTTARAIVSVLSVPEQLGAAPIERPEGRHAFDDLDFASAVVFSPDGALAYVAFQGSERVVVLDAVSMNIAGSFHDVGFAPQGLSLSADGSRLLVQAYLSRSIRVYSTKGLGDGPPSLLAEIRTVGQERLSEQVLLGKRIFHSAADPRMSKASYLSCASCHLDGEGDNLVWDFSGRGEGLRNTIPLKGREGGHGLLHFSGNFDELQDFEQDIRGPQQGAGFLADAVFHQGTVAHSLGDPKAGLSPELDALAAYIQSLKGWGVSPYRRPDDSAWLAARQRGQQLFFSTETNCSGCHAGSDFTDSGRLPSGEARLHDVGTLSAGSGSRLGGVLPGLDTPTLRGLWKSAPYLHDGSALSLRAVLVGKNPEDKHGVTSHLSPGDLADLEAYLLTLDDWEP